MGASVARPVVALMTGIAEYQLRLVAGMAAFLSPTGIPLLVVANEPFGSERTPSLVLDLIRRRVPRGVVALADESELRGRELPEALAREGIPTVTLGTRFHGAPRVHGDNEGGMRRLMAHLLDECGVRRPMLVRGVPHQLDARAREAVFRTELARRGLAVEDDLVVEGRFRLQNAYDTVRDLLRRRRDVDAVVALNDPSAMGALSAAVDLGLRVPQDILVSGFDGTDGSVLSWPPVTTVDQGLAEQGRRSVELLLDIISGAPHEDDVLVPAKLVVRASTDIAGGLINSTAPEHLAALPGVRRVDGEAVIPVAELAGRLEEVVASAHTLQARATLQAAALSLNWSMANCRTMDDVVAALGPCLDRLGVHRCFLAVDHAPVPGVDEADHPARVVLSYRGGRMERATGDVFPRHELLPAPLRRELEHGVLLLQPLSIAGRERGYLLYEPVARSSVLTEALRIDLPRTVDTVLSSQELQDHAAMLEQLVARRTRQLEEANVELQRSVLRDGLTGIASRMAFQRHLEQLTGAPESTGAPLAMLMVDVDRFKDYNDLHGHLAGDEALRAVAEALSRCFAGPGTLACRYGGEEFAVVLPGVDLAAATALAEEFRRSLADAAIPHGASPVAAVVTVSIGVAATRLRPGFRPRELLADADRALYRAKLLGRNRVVPARRRRTRSMHLVHAGDDGGGAR